MVILGLDPAIKNFGYSVCTKDSSGTVLPRESGILKNPVNAMGLESQELVAKFLEEIKTTISTHSVRQIVVERFQARNITRDIQIECVNAMIGALLTLDTPIRLIYASHWKNEINRTAAEYGFLLDNKKKLGSPVFPVYDSVYPKLRCTPHEFDASCIAIYGFATELKPFKEFLGTRESLVNHVNKLESVSTSKLKKKPQWQ